PVPPARHRWQQGSIGLFHSNSASRRPFFTLRLLARDIFHTTNYIHFLNCLLITDPIQNFCHQHTFLIRHHFLHHSPMELPPDQNLKPCTAVLRHAFTSQGRQQNPCSQHALLLPACQNIHVSGEPQYLHRNFSVRGKDLWPA